MLWVMIASHKQQAARVGAGLLSSGNTQLPQPAVIPLSSSVLCWASCLPICLCYLNLKTDRTLSMSRKPRSSTSSALMS